jgi:hypothetical protein
MNANPKDTQLRHDDIDLIVLLQRGISFFKKHKWIFIAATVTGLLLGFLRYRSLSPIYQSRLVLQSTILSNQNAIQIVTNWNALLKSREYTELATIFKCKSDMLHKVKEIKAEEIQKIFTPTNPNGFTIDARVTDISILDDLQKGIINGFDNSESVKDRLTAKRTRLLELIDKTSDEIQRLDTTKKTIANILTGKSAGPSLIIDASGISRQLIEMNEKHLFYKEELKFATAIQVLQSFSKFKKPIGPSLFVWLVLGLAFCLSIAFIYVVFSSVNQKLKKHAQLRKVV